MHLLSVLYADLADVMRPELGTWGIFEFFNNNNGAEIGYSLDKKCKKIFFYY